MNAEQLPVYLQPPRVAAIRFNEQLDIYIKQLQEASQSLQARKELLGHLHTMRWPAVLLDQSAMQIQYSQEDEPPSITVETPPFTEIVAPTTAQLLKVDTINHADIGLTSYLLYAEAPKLTILLGNIATRSIPDRYKDLDHFNAGSKTTVKEGESLGFVGRLYIGVYPYSHPEVKYNSLFLQMAHQPRGPTESYPRNSIVSPLPYLKQLV